MATVGGNLLQRTRCGYFQDVGQAVQQADARQRLPRRRRASTTTTRSSAPPSTAWPPTPRTWPWRSPPSTPSWTCSNRDGDRHVAARRLLPLPGDHPHRETALARRRADHRRRPAARARAAALPLPQGARARLVRLRDRLVAAALDVDDGVGTRRAPRLRGRRVPAVAGPDGRARCCWRPRRPTETVRAAADAELAAARAAAPQRIQGDLAQPRRGRADRTRGNERDPMTTRTPGVRRRTVRPSAPRTPASRAATRSPAPARYAAEIPFAELAHGWPVLSTVARGRVRPSTPTASSPMPGVLAVLHHENAPRLGPVPDDAELDRSLQLPARPVPHRLAGRRWSSPTPSEQARGAAPRRVRVHVRRGAARRRFVRTTRTCTRRRRSTAELSRR